MSEEERSNRYPHSLCGMRTHAIIRARDEPQRGVSPVKKRIKTNKPRRGDTEQKPFQMRNKKTNRMYTCMIYLKDVDMIEQNKSMSSQTK